MVEPELDRSFGDFVAQATAEIADRVEIRQRSLDRHFKRKIDSLSEHQSRLEEQAELARRHGDSRRATNLKNLAGARGVMKERLHRTWRLRRNDLETQRSAVPEESDVGCVFLQVDA